MYKVEIDGQEFSAIQKWNEMPLEVFIKLCKIDLPAKYISLHCAATDEEYNKAFDSITDEDSLKIFPQMYGKVIGILTDIPDHLLETLPSDIRTEVFYTAFHHFVMSVIHEVPLNVIGSEGWNQYESDDSEYFEHEGEKYLYPKSIRISNLETPMANEPVVTFIESSELMLTWKKLSEAHEQSIAMIIAIYCRKEGEKYNEATALARSAQFQKLSMDIVWKVFFCIVQLMPLFLKDTLLFPKSNLNQASKEARLKLTPLADGH